LKNSIENKEIPRFVDNSEILVRGFFYFIHYDQRKNRLKESLFLPRISKGMLDVSTLRLEYTNADFCKNHSSSIHMGEGQEYKGLALIQVGFIRKSGIKQLVGKKIDVKGTPLDEKQEVILESIKSYIDDKGLPMHADIIYEMKIIEGEPIPQDVKKLAKFFAKHSEVFLDPDTESQDWTGKPLKSKNNWDEILLNLDS
jgi:hypothetical protein